MDRCVQATEVCAAACESALAADDSYTRPGTDPFSEAHLALVSCVSVCSLVMRALRDGDGDLALLRWCAETCSQCAAGERPERVPEPMWSLVVRASMRCAMACEAAIERISDVTRNALRASRDTDFQSLGA